MPAILITGAGRGLGLELAQQYAADQWTVLGTVRDAAGEAKLAALGARAFRVDVADPAAVKRLGAKLAGTPIDVLFCNAGISGKKGMALGSFDYAEWEQVLRVNLLGSAAVVEALVDNVAASGRKTVALMSSRMGSIAESGGQTLPYSTSKAALNMLAKALAVTLAPRGIRVVALHPGWARTDMGGPGATVSPETSVRGLRNIVDQLQPQDSGAFFAYDGSRIPW